MTSYIQLKKRKIAASQTIILDSQKLNTWSKYSQYVPGQSMTFPGVKPLCQFVSSADGGFPDSQFLKTIDGGFPSTHIVCVYSGGKP